MKLKRVRVDQLLVVRGIVESRQKAQALILANEVLVNDQPISKPGATVAEDVEIRLRNEPSPYVSRGAYKLKEAIEKFNINVSQKITMDVGASTGGFTQILLEMGAKQVFAVDVGKNQMSWKIRNDARVKSLEGVNARYLDFETIGTTLDLIVIDVSFISLRIIMPSLKKFSTPETDWISLIKPQFEVGKKKVGKGGIVSEAEDRLQAIQMVTNELAHQGFKRVNLIDSPITGTKGNQEYLALWKVT